MSSADAVAPATRWGDGRRADTDFAREHLLDAASACYQRHGVLKTTVEHIAREAKVSRTTVYRYFRNRDEVVAAVVVRATRDLMQRLEERVRGFDEFGDYIVETLEGVLDELPRSAVFRQLLAEDSAAVRRICLGSSDVAEQAVRFMQPHFERAERSGRLRPGVELGALMEWLMLVVSSFLGASEIGDPSSAAQLRNMLKTFVLPGILVA